MTDINKELDDLKYIGDLKKNILYFEGRYHLRMAEKNFELADVIKNVIDLFKQDLKGCEDELIASDSGTAVSPAQYGGDKTVFILKK